MGKKKSAWGKCLHLSQELGTSSLSGCRCGMCLCQVWAHLLGDILATFEVMVSIRQDFRFHNRHNAILQVREEWY